MLALSSLFKKEANIQIKMNIKETSRHSYKIEHKASIKIMIMFILRGQENYWKARQRLEVQFRASQQPKLSGSGS